MDSGSWEALVSAGGLGQLKQQNPALFDAAR